MPMNASSLPAPLLRTIEKLKREFALIPPNRQDQLNELGHFLRTERATARRVAFTVICTHNSRRSHFGQLWLAAATRYYRLSGVESYSGGTEATAFIPRAVEALRHLGFPLQQTAISENPIYQCHWDDGTPVRDLFSKVYTAPPNPRRDFAAVLVCEAAAETCPVVVGAKARFTLTYRDPKRFDDSPDPDRHYRECAEQIGREVLFALYPGQIA